ncbi:protein translocase subunit SecD [Natronospirillum operosum]|uniref:Protein translocase subunit SecD n=1 Tax=Natronospirillum operosum TaxID=2759953 RepID=A0A4Z0WA45_9GAMM|nr:protein translocase subunit SecD [Natronospirillum operosum]TGG90407.1 protein translocase subunit SecD [Natronospirillum operosum]
MLNRFPLWKYLMVAIVVLMGLVYSLPNLYPADYALQISPSAATGSIGSQVEEESLELLQEQNIAVRRTERDNGTLLIRLENPEDQLVARTVVQQALGDDFVVALNQAETTPRWLQAIGARPMALGLDLSGGVHFLMEVDMDEYLGDRMADYASTLRRELRAENIRFATIEQTDDRVITASFRTTEDRSEAENLIRRQFPEFSRSSTSDGQLQQLRLVISEDRIEQLQSNALQQNLTTLSNRVNELGVAEPLVQRQGNNRIVVELPGIQDTAAAKRVIGRAAELEFRLEARSDASPLDREEYPFREGSGRSGTAELSTEVIATGENVTGANFEYDENNRPQVSVNLNSAGGSRMMQATRQNVGRNMGVLFIEYNTITTYRTVDGERVAEYENVVDRSIISLATIQSAFGPSFRITGLNSAAEASELALLLRAGALAAPMYFVEERTIGPSLGADNIRMGVTSVIVGFMLVIAFMILWYRTFGLFANIALSVNLLLIMAIMSTLGATLTLPGIAGIVLTVGMAVDANVLIFSRIREELDNGVTPQAAIKAGFDRAFVTILDANITTLIVAVILFAVGTGAVRGFAVTLSVGILTSMFTAILGTRSLVNLFYGGRDLKRVPIWGVWAWRK